MKVLMISPQPFFTPRGTPFSVYHRTRTMAALGHKIDLVTYHIGRDVAIPNVTLHRIPSVPFIKHVKIGPSFKKLILDAFLFLKCFWMLARHRYDVIHAHEEAVFFCLVYRLFFWRMKILYDMHSSLPQQLRNFDFSENRLLIGTFRFLENWALRSSAAVITICPELRATVDALALKTPHRMIENSLCDAVALSDEGDVITDDLINWDRFAGKKIVLYTGTFEYYQGIPLLLESVCDVVARRPDTVFILIGGTSHQVHTMRKEAARLGIRPFVVFTGNVHPNTVKLFIRKADVLVSPRIRGNNTPLKIYEYLASGKPIVATDHQTHTQVLSENEAVLASAESVGFAEKIVAVLDDPGAGERLGRQATSLYETAYGATVYMSRLKEILGYFGNAEETPAAILNHAVLANAPTSVRR